MTIDTKRRLEHTSQIVSSYLSHNQLPPAQLPDLIKTVARSLSLKPIDPPAEIEKPVPSLTPLKIKRTITENGIVCLEDGKVFKSLKRHLRTKYGMSPHDYRLKWNLPSDYPMIAPGLAEMRSRIAKKSGLGRGPQKTPRKSASA